MVNMGVGRHAVGEGGMRESRPGVRSAGVTQVLRAALCCAWLATAADVVEAQSTVQLWGDVSLNGLTGPQGRGAWAVDIEPQLQVAAPSGSPAWYASSLTPSGEYAVRPWLDALGEIGATYTRQTDGLRSFELTPRAGIRLYLLSRNVPTVRGMVSSDLPPKRRVVIRDLVRVESRNLFYSDDTEQSSTVRLRNRLEFQVPLNRARVTDDGARTLLADWEWFLPLDDPSERFANRQRIRTGIAVRQSYTWRCEVLYIWTRSRDTTADPFSTSENALFIAVRRFYR